MASPAEKLSIFLLLTLLSSLHTHARDSQFFNKIPSTTNNAVVPTNKEAPTNQQEPNFLPQNENSYGLYGHESGQDPPSAAADTTTTTTTAPAATEFKQPPNKYLPKNYNPVAYVTQPENVNEGGNAFTEERSFTTNPDNNNNNKNKNNYYNNDQNYNYNNQQQQEEEATEFRSYPTAANNRDNGAANNFYYNGGSSFNSRPQGDGGATFDSRGAAANNFQPQGMSDTRYVENGKYFYDINSEKYSRNHPYQSLRGVQPQNEEFNNRNFYGNNANEEFNNRNFYGNNANEEFNNVNEFNGENSMGGYQEFQNEENNMP